MEEHDPSQQVGGLDFKELQTFNSSLLTKMVARVLSELNALWIKVLKGLYYLNGNFLSDEKGARTSWA